MLALRPGPGRMAAPRMPAAARSILLAPSERERAGPGRTKLARPAPPAWPATPQRDMPTPRRGPEPMVGPWQPAAARMTGAPQPAPPPAEAAVGAGWAPRQ